MTLKPYLVFLLAATLAVSCGQPARRNAECVGSLETSAKQTTVKTVSGPVAGYPCLPPFSKPAPAAA